MFLLILSYICLLIEMIIQFCRIAKVWRSRLARHKTILLFSLYFMIAIIVALGTGASQYYKLSGAGLLSSMGLYNIYVWCLQYLYSFSGTGIQKEKTLRDVDSDYQANREFAYMDNLEEDPEEMARDKKLDFRMDVDDLNDGNEPANGGALENQGMNPDKVFKVGQPPNPNTGEMGLGVNPDWGAWQEKTKASHESNAGLGLRK
jgi:hypothetical protein